MALFNHSPNNIIEERGEAKGLNSRRSEGTRSFRYRFRAKVLYEKNIGSERSHSTEVRKERSEGTRSLKYRRGATRLRLGRFRAEPTSIVILGRREMRSEGIPTLFSG